jgi:hypothetical protein
MHVSDHYASGRAWESVGYADEHARTAQAHLAAATEEDLQNIARMKELFMSAALPGSGDGGPSLPALLLTPEVLAAARERLASATPDDLEKLGRMKQAVLRGAALPGSGGEAASSSSAAEQSCSSAVLSPDAIAVAQAKLASATPEDIKNMARMKAELLARLASKPQEFDAVSVGAGAAASCFSGASCSLHTIPNRRAAASAERVAQLRELYSSMISGHNEPDAAASPEPLVGGSGSSPNGPWSAGLMAHADTSSGEWMFPGTQVPIGPRLQAMMELALYPFLPKMAPPPTMAPLTATASKHSDGGAGGGGSGQGAGDETPLLPPNKYVEQMTARAPWRAPWRSPASSGRGDDVEDDADEGHEADETARLRPSGVDDDGFDAEDDVIKPEDAVMKPPVLPAPSALWGHSFSMLGTRTGTPVPPLAPSKGEHSEVDALRRALRELFMMLELRDAEICELKDQARCDRNAIERLRTRLSQEMARRTETMMDTALAASTQAISMLQEEQAIKDVLAEQKGAAVAKRGAGQPDLLRIVELPSEEAQALRARMHTLRVELAAVEGRLEELEAAPTGAVLPRV